VEVDTETGATKIRKYVCVDDIGNVINPLIVEGQVHGGLVQGIAQALFEEAVYDESGTLVTGSFVDYLVPSAATCPASSPTAPRRRRRPTRSESRASARPAPSRRRLRSSMRWSTRCVPMGVHDVPCRARRTGCGSW
jgi:carbon-monoxide dehydrogenase large subunit